MKNYEAKKLYEGLRKLGEGDYKMPALVNYARFRSTKNLEPIVSAYDMAIDEVLLKYGKPADEAGKYTLLPEKIADYYKETNELAVMDIECEIVKFPADKIMELPDLPGDIFDALIQLAKEESKDEQ